MYLDFYSLSKEPFHCTPDPDFLFPGRSHREALAGIFYGIEKRKGFLSITGEVGSGKTTILRSYLARADRERLKIIYIFYPEMEIGGFLDTIFQEMGIEFESDDLAQKVCRLQQALIEEYRAGRTVVLIIDEAQNIHARTLEQLRMLSNLETNLEKLIQIVLVGQPELDRKLARHELRQFRQRIAIRVVLKALGRSESAAYVCHRLGVAGAGKAPVFSRGALGAIVRRARGNPRVLNVLCDNALLAGYGEQKKPIPARLVREVIRDYDAESPDAKGSRLAQWARAWLRFLAPPQRPMPEARCEPYTGDLRLPGEKAKPIEPPPPDALPPSVVAPVLPGAWRKPGFEAFPAPPWARRARRWALERAPGGAADDVPFLRGRNGANHKTYATAGSPDAHREAVTSIAERTHSPLSFGQEGTEYHD